jgi:hypothetical protein
MFSDADAELERIDPFNCAAPEVLAVRIAIYHGMRKWEAMREIAKRLADFDRRTSSGRYLMPTQPEELNQLRQPRRFSLTQRRDFRKRRSSNTTLLAMAASWEKSKTLKTI